MDQAILGSSVGSLRNGIIDNITTDRGTTLITVSHSTPSNRGRDETIRLAIGRNTAIIDESGNDIRPSDLVRGMTINALFSNAMTRSIPPQANAFFIQVVRRPMSDNTTVGRIININRRGNNFTTISDNNLATTIQFNVSPETRFFDIFGRPINFNDLLPGFRVRVRHASFMTASIPPQTTAFEVRVIR